MPGQAESSKHRLRDPATTIVRSKRAVLHDHHLCVGQLDTLFTRRDQDSEIGDSCFRPLAKTLRDFGFVAFVDGIELAALRRSAGPNQPVTRAVELERPHRFLNFVLLVIFELSGWDIEASNTNAGIETFEERISKLLLSSQSWQSLLHLPVLVDVERRHRHSTAHFSR